MIARLTGEVLEKEAAALIISAGGVGYRVAVLPRVWMKVNEGDEVALRIHHHSSAESQALYGFDDAHDLQLFVLLLTVPSVGPRTAIGILEVAPPQVLEQAVAENDTATLTKVSGVGRKTAERILVELKEKITAPVTAGTGGGMRQQTVEALISIGFTAHQARVATQKLPADVASVEEAVRLVLRRQAA